MLPTLVPENNGLLSALPHKDRQRLLALCEPVTLAFADVLSSPGERIRQVYFPTGSIIALSAPLDDQVSLGVGLVGDEGMLGVSLILGVSRALQHAVVQGAGSALRMDRVPFCQALKHSEPLQDALKHYLYVLMVQLGQSAACSHFHVVVVRLARWLLMTQERAHSDHFHVTHEFLAGMLGVRRVGITKAAMALHDQHLISYSRGEIRILDQHGLEDASCGCYEADKAIYERLMG
ncbi:Crp/Fnr family transcriptional regulator [Leeia oryzae]|uniref:Crp/Fnr family transcriptional regulator n=1 Tax=Leeia oryzae TaxID=356662 RepID=UPI00036F5842|nr:Crp/Fnr family transcriptional regulator [Leeia oryzae]